MKKKMSNGLYLVVDSTREKEHILKQLQPLKNTKLAAIQIWNPFKLKKLDESLLQKVIELFYETPTPILINNDWKLLLQYAFDGIHFDQYPNNISMIHQKIERDFIKGITLENHLNLLPEIEKSKFDYVSFCSIFPSSTANSCELVTEDTLLNYKDQSDLPFYLSGGINLNNLQSIKHLHSNGIAVSAAIMDSSNPLKTVNQLYEILNFKHEL